jgi:hypothetical protein
MAIFFTRLLARPIFVPIAFLSTGIFYGSYDISKIASRYIMNKKDSNPSGFQNTISFIPGLGVLYASTLFNPFLETQKEIFNKFSFNAMKKYSSTVLRYNIGALVIAGVTSGITTAVMTPSNASLVKPVQEKVLVVEDKSDEMELSSQKEKGSKATQE